MNGISAKLRVGFLTYGLERPLSGIGRVTLELGRALQRSDVELVYLTPYHSGPFPERAELRVLVFAGLRSAPWPDDSGRATSLSRRAVCVSTSCTIRLA